MLLIILSKLSITKVEKDAETTPSVAKISRVILSCLSADTPDFISRVEYVQSFPKSSE